MILRKLIKKILVLSYLTISLVDFLMTDIELKSENHIAIQYLFVNLYQTFLLILEIVYENLANKEHV